MFIFHSLTICIYCIFPNILRVTTVAVTFSFIRLGVLQAICSKYYKKGICEYQNELEADYALVLPFNLNSTLIRVETQNLNKQTLISLSSFLQSEGRGLDPKLPLKRQNL